MSAPLQTFLLALVIGMAFAWINQPALSLYSLQVFSLSVLLYFISKRLSNSKLWHVTPAHESWEMVMATFAFSLLIGATGNTQSPFFSLTYVHLFFLVMATHYSTSLVVAGLLVLFHYALEPSAIATSWPTLISIPLILVFFLFGKRQREEVLREQRMLTAVQADEASLLNFVRTYLSIKISQLKELAKYGQFNQDAIMGQLLLIEIEMQSVLDQVTQPKTADNQTNENQDDEDDTVVNNNDYQN
jgi:hypothetical protein